MSRIPFHLFPNMLFPPAAEISFEFCSFIWIIALLAPSIILHTVDRGNPADQFMLRNVFGTASLSQESPCTIHHVSVQTRSKWERHVQEHSTSTSIIIHFATKYSLSISILNTQSISYITLDKVVVHSDLEKYFKSHIPLSARIIPPAPH